MVYKPIECFFRKTKVRKLVKRCKRIKGFLPNKHALILGNASHDFKRNIKPFKGKKY